MSIGFTKGLSGIFDCQITVGYKVLPSVENGMSRTAGSLLDHYRRLLWGSMEIAGVRDSIERKFMMAVTIQFVAAMTILVIPPIFMGPGHAMAAFSRAQIFTTAIVVGIATLAYVNTIWIVRRDILEPVVELREVATDLAQGNLDSRPTEPFQIDETGDLKRAMVDLQSYLSKTANQATAISREEFDDPVLNEQIPGSFGDALDEMKQRLEDRITGLRKFQAAVDNAGHAICLTDESGTIGYLNEEYETLIDSQGNGTALTHISDIPSEETEPEVMTKMREAMEAGDRWTGELIFRPDTNQRYIINQTIAPIHEDGSRIGYVAIGQDVTERRLYEDELKRKSEQLEALNRVIRHDISNDMNIVLGRADLLEPHINSEARDHFEAMMDAADHVVELTEVVKDFVDALAADRELDQEPIDVGKILKSEVSSQRTAFPEATFDVDESLTGHTVDATRMLSSAFQNLLRNAVQHNDSDTPRVEITTETRAPTAASSDVGDDAPGVVRIEIADNGPGVPPDKREEIFGRGEKGLQSEGTGIGLYLVHTLVDLYDGEVWVEDNDPSGARFVMEFPSATEDT